MEMAVGQGHHDQIDQQHILQIPGVPAHRHEAFQGRLDIECRIGTLPEPRDGQLPVLRRHAQFLHELLDVVDLVLRDASIRFCQLAHGDEHRLQEHRLAHRILQRIQRPLAERAHAVDE
jgi:hypothetical protein